MTENLRWLGHAGFMLRSAKGTVVCFDPYKVRGGLAKADVVLVSHDHFDHCSPDDIKEVSKPGTVVVGPAAVAGKAGVDIRVLGAGGRLAVGEVLVEAVPAYNPAKPYHPRAAGYVGFVAEVDGVRFYHAGDTDLIPEMGEFRADVALLPVGGTYTMTAAEAARAAAAVKARIAVPMHYGAVVGSIRDAAEFKKLCACEVRVLEPWAGPAAAS